LDILIFQNDMYNIMQATSSSLSIVNLMQLH
jgi:hypothetical protein